MRPTTLLATCALLWPALAGAEKQPPSPGQPPPEISIPYERYELANGLEVLLHVDRAVPVAHVELWYHVGSKDEEPGRTGFAHLFEHMMFQGSKHWDDEFFNALSAYGAQINGTTNTDRTNYFETVPSHVLERALWLEADRMGTLLDVLTKEKLDNQRDVVRNERRQNYENRPYGEVWKALAEGVWPAWHPYHHLTIGTHEDLEAATLDDVKAFFARWYVPNNATLVVAGDFDVAQTRQWIERYFGGIQRGAEPRPPTRIECPPPAARTVELVDDVQLSKVVFAWQSPAMHAPGDAELDVLSLLLTDGKSSRLQNRLVLTDRLAKDVSAAQYSDQYGSIYAIDVTVAPGHTVEEVQAAITEEVERLLKDGPTAAELERARNQWKKGFYQRLEGVAGKASLLQMYNHYLGEPGAVGRDLQRYLAVTQDALLEHARRTLKAEHRVTIVVRPEAAPAGK